ncbi:hypothetical protein FPQ18DRAFT_376812 [Pyronema domesticum]|nr:hypothetical protein FPQ18DRAFT_376812 [Pyronema domesticum]
MLTFLSTTISGTGLQRSIALLKTFYELKNSSNGLKIIFFSIGQTTYQLSPISLQRLRRLNPAVAPFGGPQDTPTSSDLLAVLVSRRMRFGRDKLPRSLTSERILSTYNVAYEIARVELDLENLAKADNRESLTGRMCLTGSRSHIRWAREEATLNNLRIVEDSCRACGHTNCARFFKLCDYGDQDASTDVLEYTEAFLNAETPRWEHCSEPPTDLNPPPHCRRKNQP